ncbi:MAG TPA: nuclear transport factor 2 family protein [Candidatus Saccharimonadales bacterium]|nr:nuclear transport factor 2 family protein [Candidatus Saccharimonadales bacterium]
MEANYAKDVIFLTGTGGFKGWEDVKASASELEKFVGPDAVFEYRHTLIEEDYAFLEWTANLSKGEVCDGADSFVIKGGKIVFQSIHYTVSRN